MKRCLKDDDRFGIMKITILLVGLSLQSYRSISPWKKPFNSNTSFKKYFIMYWITLCNRKARADA